MEKIASKNRIFYQELIGLSGTFASLVKQGLIIDKSGLRTMNGASQEMLNRSSEACQKIQKEKL